MADATSQKREFPCPTCLEEGRSTKVVFDPGDPMNEVVGALRRRRDAAASVVYLTCDRGHVHRYALAEP